MKWFDQIGFKLTGDLEQSPAPELWFCQQHQEFPSSLPSKNYSNLLLLNLSFWMETGVSKMARAVV